VQTISGDGSLKVLLVPATGIPQQFSVCSNREHLFRPPSTNTHLMKTNTCSPYRDPNSATAGRNLNPTRCRITDAKPSPGGRGLVCALLLVAAPALNATVLRRRFITS